MGKEKLEEETWELLKKCEEHFDENVFLFDPGDLWVNTYIFRRWGEQITKYTNLELEKYFIQLIIYKFKSLLNNKTIYFTHTNRRDKSYDTKFVFDKNGKVKSIKRK